MAQGLPPHKDPSQERDEFDAVAFLGFFAIGLSKLADREFDDVSELMDILSFANIPDNLRIIALHFGELLKELGTNLSSADHSLGRASTFLDEDDHAAARAELESARQSLAMARTGLQDLGLAAEEMTSRLGISSVTPLDRLGQMSTRLQELLAQMDKIWGEYIAALEELDTATLEAAISPELVPVPELPISLLDTTGLYELNITFDSPRFAYPGRPLHIAGELTSDGPSTDSVNLRVLLDDQVIHSFVSSSRFDQTVTMPDDTTLGMHVLSLDIQESGRYGAAIKKRRLEVIQAEPQMTLQAPHFALIPKTISFSGEVSSGFGPAMGATVNLRLGDSRTTVRTDRQGNFSGSLTAPSGSLLIGTQHIDVSVSPAEPWNAHLVQRANLFIVSIASIVAILSTIGYIAFALVMAWRRGALRFDRSPKQEAELAGIVPEMIQPSVSTPAPVAVTPSIDPTSPQGRVFSSYLLASRYLAESLSIPYQAYFTMRDFLDAVRSLVSSPFVRLSRITEQSLYSDRPTQEEDVELANELANSVLGGKY